MRSKTKIVVLHMKELIYTGIFILLGVLFLILLILMFLPDKKQDTEQTSQSAYVPGIYTTSLALGDSTLEMEIVLDENNINSIRLVDLSEAVTTMYPLVEPAFDDLVSQITTGTTLDQITYSDDNRYTSSILLQTIQQTLDKASPNAQSPTVSGE